MLVCRFAMCFQGQHTCFLSETDLSGIKPTYPRNLKSSALKLDVSVRRLKLSWKKGLWRGRLYNLSRQAPLCAGQHYVEKLLGIGYRRNILPLRLDFGGRHCVVQWSSST